jgi:hypothetical protein
VTYADGAAWDMARKVYEFCNVHVHIRGQRTLICSSAILHVQRHARRGHVVRTRELNVLTACTATGPDPKYKPPPGASLPSPPPSWLRRHQIPTLAGANTASSHRGRHEHDQNQRWNSVLGGAEAQGEDGGYGTDAAMDVEEERQVGRLGASLRRFSKQATGEGHTYSAHMPHRFECQIEAELRHTTVTARDTGF